MCSKPQTPYWLQALSRTSLSAHQETELNSGTDSAFIFGLWKAFCVLPKKRQSVYGFSRLCNTNGVNAVMSYGPYVRQMSMKGVRHVCVWLYVCGGDGALLPLHTCGNVTGVNPRKLTWNCLHRLLFSRCAVSSPAKRRWDEGFLYRNVFYTTFATNHILQLAF